MSWLLAVLRALPAIADLLKQLAKALKESQAKGRRHEKDTTVDDRIDAVLNKQLHNDIPK